jgi:hypothetical protein
MILDEYGTEDRSRFSRLGFVRLVMLDPLNVITIGSVCLCSLHLRPSDGAPSASSLRRFLARRRDLFEQGIEVVSLEEAVVVHRMANGSDLASDDPLRRVFGEMPRYSAASEMRGSSNSFSTSALPDTCDTGPNEPDSRDLTKGRDAFQ